MAVKILYFFIKIENNKKNIELSEAGQKSAMSQSWSNQLSSGQSYSSAEDRSACEHPFLCVPILLPAVFTLPQSSIGPSLWSLGAQMAAFMGPHDASLSVLCTVLCVTC